MKNNIEGKIPPQALDIEDVVLGSMMLESGCINAVLNIIQPDAFYTEKNQTIARAIADLYRKNQPVDILTVCEQLRENASLDIVGGPYAVTILTDRIASTANVEYHARIILQKFIQRELIRKCSELINDAYNDTIDPLDLVDRMGKDYDGLSSLAQSGAEMVHISIAAHESEVELKKREKFAKEGKVSGIPTPLRSLDKILGGWMKSDLVIVAARPGMGKTAFMLQIAKTAATSGFHVCIFSLEMSNVSLSNRMLLAESGIDDEKFRSGFVSQDDWNLFGNAKRTLSALPIYIDDRPGLSMHQIKAKSVQMKRSGRCSIILIDYLQLTSMKSENRQYNREQEVSESSRTAKGLAKLIDLPVILLSQLSRASEHRGGNKIPMLSDLRESGSIEQDADIVIFPHRPAYYNIEGSTANEGVIDIIVAKHRNGPVGTASAKHNKSMTKIYDVPNGEIYENKAFESDVINPF